MKTSSRRRYKVYSKEYFLSEDHKRSDEWKYIGETTAVSEKQAINNIRYRIYGNISQYKPIAVSSNWQNGLIWKAELI